MTLQTETDDDLDLLEETVEVEPPRRILGGSIASFVVLTVVAVGVGIALVTGFALYGLPVIQAIPEFVDSR